MKKLIIIIFLIGILAGCRQNINDNETFEDANFDFNNVIDINIQTRYFYGFDPESNKDIQEKFADVLKEKFGLNLKISGIGETIITKQDVENFDGLIRIGRIGFNNFYSAESISPITEYLADNKIWNNLPEYFKINGEINGGLWAIPANTIDLPIFYSRFVRNDWLEEVALDTPNTIDEYYELLQKFTYNDPDGNQINDTYGFISNGIQGLHDIFNAFDCRIPFSTEYFPTWDPLKNMYVDGLQEPNIIECLNFLNNCYEQKLLHNSFMETDQRTLMSKYYKGNIGSLSNFINYHDDIELRTGINHKIITALKGEIDEKIIPALVECSEFYIVPINMKNKEVVVNRFVNVFLGTELGYFMGNYGVPDTDIEENDFTINKESVILHVEIEEGQVKMKETPNLIQGHPVFSKYEIFYSASDEYPNNVISNYDRQIRVELLKNHSEDFYYMTNLKKTLDYRLFDYYENNSAWLVSQLGTKTIEQCIKGEVDIKEAVFEYNKQVEKLGMDFILQTANSDFGH